MSTVPAQSFSAPARAVVMAAARVMPGVCGVLESSSPARTTRTPLVRQSVAMATVSRSRDRLREWGSRTAAAPGNQLDATHRETLRSGGPCVSMAPGIFFTMGAVTMDRRPRGVVLIIGESVLVAAAALLAFAALQEFVLTDGRPL